MMNYHNHISTLKYKLRNIMSPLRPPSVATQIYLRKIITRAQSFQYLVIHDWSHNRVTDTGANNLLGQLYKIIFDAIKHYEYLAHKNDIIIQQRPSRQQKHSFDKTSINGKHSFHKGQKLYVLTSTRCSHLLKGMIYASLTLLRESMPTTYQPVI
jgi:hypothetical protein